MNKVRVLAMALAFLCMTWLTGYAGQGFDYNNDGDIDCLCGSLDNGECIPCALGVLAGHVECEDGTPVDGEPVIIQHLFLKVLQKEILTGERGNYWDFFSSGLFKITVAGQVKFNYLIPDLKMVGINKWVILCETTTTTICKTTTTTPATTSKGLTTSIPNTTTVSPTTIRPTTTTTQQGGTTSVRTTSVPVSTTVAAANARR